MPVMSDSLGLCVVALVKLLKQSLVLTKVSCKLCSWAPEAFTTLHRVKEHFGDLPLAIELTSTVCRLPGGGQRRVCGGGGEPRGHLWHASKALGSSREARYPGEPPPHHCSWPRAAWECTQELSGRLCGLCRGTHESLEVSPPASVGCWEGANIRFS